MLLIHNWREIVLHAWSVRWMAASAVFSALEVALPLAEGWLPVPRGLFAALCGLSAAGGFVSRLIAQKRFHQN